MRSFANLVFVTQHPKMQQALAWIPAQDQEPRAVREII
jgi:hypothetical protein